MFIIIAVIKAPLEYMVDDLCGAGGKVIVLRAGHIVKLFRESRPFRQRTPVLNIFVIAIEYV